MRDLPVPEIYMQVKTTAEGKTTYSIIDGQQRLRAILEFLDGEFEISEEDNQEYGGKTFQNLPTGAQQKIWSYRIYSREITSNSDEEIRAIFVRMNKNVVQLNKQELRNGTYIGHFITLMNKLADEQEFFSENGIFKATDIKRMLDAEYISELFVSMMHGIQDKKEAIDQYYKLYDTIWIDKEEKKKEFDRTISLIGDVFSKSFKESRWKNKADFYSLYMVFWELNKDYYFPTENYESIEKLFKDFSDEVIAKGEASEKDYIKEYNSAIVSSTTGKTQREVRHRILRRILIPLLTPKDKKRNFTQEEREIIWAQSLDKKCGICKANVSWEEYETDHIDPHAKGGFSTLSNGQVSHKRCNASKGAKST